MAATNVTFSFGIGDIMNCYYGNKLYEVKCLHRRISNNGGVQYFVHYVGWKTRWDEWVDAKRVLSTDVLVDGFGQNVFVEKRPRKKRSYVRAKDNPVLRESETSKPPEIQVPRKRGRPPVIKRAKVAKRIHVSEAASSNVQSNENAAVGTYAPVPSTSIETPGSSTKNSSSVAQIQFTKINADRKLLQTNVTGRPSNTLEVDINEVAKKFTSSVNIGKKVLLSFSMAVTGMPLQTIKIPTLITEEMNDDYLMINSFNKVLKFPDVLTAADMIYDFIGSQKSLNIVAGENALEFGAALLNVFNSIVNKQLLYDNEKKYKIQNKGLCSFIQKGNAGNSKVYVLKELLHRKKVWCYIYGPVYLLRLFVSLSRRSIPMHDNQLAVVAAGSQSFLEFVETNVVKYFAERKYICTND